MDITNFGTNNPLAVNLWSKSIDVEALKHPDNFSLIGDDANSGIHRKTETSTPQGERFSAPQAAIRAEMAYVLAPGRPNRTSEAAVP